MLLRESLAAKAQWTSTNRRTEPHVVERGESACQAIPEKLPDREVFEAPVELDFTAATRVPGAPDVRERLTALGTEPTGGTSGYLPRTPS